MGGEGRAPASIAIVAGLTARQLGPSLGDAFRKRLHLGDETRARRTITDVARLAGVHPSTVSRALHRADFPVGAETRRRVLAAVQRLEYRPSAVARGLRLRRTRTLGMLVPDITNPFFPPIIRGAEEAARDRGYELVLCNTDDETEREKASLRVLRERQADGLLIATSRMADATLASVRRERFPFVLVNRGSRVAEDPAVEVNNARAAAEIVERAAGYRDALRDRSLPVDASSIAEAAAYSEDAGYVAARRLLDMAPTAIFAANDLLALGALRAAREKGVRVPLDLSLVGINDIPMVGLIDPPLTTARVPQREMGAIAARILISLLEHEPVRERHVRLEAELVVRRSTGVPRTVDRRVA